MKQNIPMRTIYKLSLLLLVLVQSLTGLEETQSHAIHDVINSYVDAWNHHEGVGFADNYTEEADFVNIYGMHFIGKAEIEERHQRILQTFLKGSVFEVLSTQLREVKPGFVIAIVHWRVEGFRSRNTPHAPGQKREGIFSHVFVNNNGKWEITSSQNTLLPFN
ncbi:MAG: SgcJ/EcaC family oxidoreductase [Parachlamydiales bacterium]|jgi:uncharacterized protein (TIGR02246 family)